MVQCCMHFLWSECRWLSSFSPDKKQFSVRYMYLCPVSLTPCTTKEMQFVRAFSQSTRESPSHAPCEGNSLQSYPGPASLRLPIILIDVIRGFLRFSRQTPWWCAITVFPQALIWAPFVIMSPSRSTLVAHLPSFEKTGIWDCHAVCESVPPPPPNVSSWIPLWTLACISRHLSHLKPVFHESVSSEYSSNSRIIVEPVVSYAVRVVSNESRQLVLPRLYCLFVQIEAMSLRKPISNTLK
jgi:hypothetical protein